MEDELLNVCVGSMRRYRWQGIGLVNLQDNGGLQ